MRHLFSPPPPSRPLINTQTQHHPRFIDPSRPRRSFAPRPPPPLPVVPTVGLKVGPIEVGPILESDQFLAAELKIWDSYQGSFQVLYVSLRPSTQSVHPSQHTNSNHRLRHGLWLCKLAHVYVISGTICRNTEQNEKCTIDVYQEERWTRWLEME